MSWPISGTRSTSVRDRRSPRPGCILAPVVGASGGEGNSDPSNHNRNELGNGAAGGDGGAWHANGTPGEDGRWLRSVVEHSSEMVTIVQPNGTLGYANPAWGRALGHDPDEAVGTMNVLDHVHPEDLPHVLEEVGKAFSQGGVATNEAEYRFRHADGSWRWVESVGTYLLDDPAVRGVVVTSRDVTERKEAEEAVRRSEERLRSLADAAFEGILISDRGVILEANRALIDMFGYSHSEVIGRSTLEFAAPEHRDLVRQKIASGDEEPYEAAGVRKDGTRIDLELRGKAYSYRGRSVRITAVRDVTERKAAEDRLRKTEERYRTLVERIPAVTFVDRADRAEGLEESLYVSPQIEGMLGYTPEEWAAGRLWRERLHPDDRERVLASDERFEARGEPVDQEYRLLAKDGSVVWVREETVLVRDEAGEPRFVQGIMSDVTQKKRSE